MSARTIEARAIFTAQDRSGNVFQFLAKKVETVEAATKRAQSRIEAFNRAQTKTSRMVAGAEAAVSASVRASGIKHMVATATTAVASGVVAHEIMKEGAKRLHERVRMEASGMSKDEIEEATKLSAKLSSQFKPIGETETMHMLRNARSIVGTYEEAAEIMEPLMKLRVIAQANRPGEDVSQDFDQLVKGLEIKGVTQHPEQFRKYMEGIAKGLNVFGDTLKPYQYYEMFKYGRQATPMLSDDFILSTAPTLAQELGGSSYGNAVSGFNRAIVAGRMEHSSLKELYRLGLVKEEDLDFLKSGEVKGLKTGRSVQGWRTAQSDPNAWVREYLIPAMQKLGINGAEAMMKEVGIVFSNRMAAQLVGILATQQSRIDKDRALVHRAPGLAAAERYMKADFSIAVQGLRAQLENAAAAIGAPLARDLTPIVNAAATAMANFTRHVEDATNDRSQGERPESAKLLQRAFNRVVFDVDSDKEVSEIPKDAWRDRDLRWKRESLQNDSSFDKERGIRAKQSKRDRQHKDISYLKRHPMERQEPDHSSELAEIEDARKRLRELDWASLQRMLAEYNLQANIEKQKATREPFNRLKRRTTPTVPGALAMPLSIGYGGVDRFTMNVGNHPRPEVAMPPAATPAAAQAPQKVQVGFETVKVETTVKVDASSNLLNAVADAKKVASQAKAFAIGRDTGPGGLGETSTAQ